MGNNKINVRDLALYFDGKALYYGELQENKYGERLFYNAKQCFGLWLRESNTNIDFNLNGDAIMVLREAIEENAYGEERNRNLQNAGLDADENRLINKMYEVGEMEVSKLDRLVVILGKKIVARLRNEKAQADFSAKVDALVGQEDASEA